MKVFCIKCNAAYNLDTSRLTENEIKVRCSRCKTIFTITLFSEKELSNVTEKKITKSTFERPEESITIWRVRLQSGLTYGFNDLGIVKNWIREKKITQEDFVFKKGDTWKKIDEVDEFKALFLDNNIKNSIIDEKDVKIAESSDLEFHDGETSPGKDLPEIEEKESFIKYKTYNEEPEKIFNNTFKDRRHNEVESKILDEESYVGSKYNIFKEPLKKTHKKSKIKILIFLLILVILAGLFITNKKLLRKTNLVYNLILNKITSQKEIKTITEPSKKQLIKSADYEQNENYKLARKYFNLTVIDNYEKIIFLYKKLLDKYQNVILVSEYAEILAFLGYETNNKNYSRESLEYTIFSFSINKDNLNLSHSFRAMALYYIAHDDKKEYEKLTEHYLNFCNPDAYTYYVWGLYFLKQAEIKKAKENFIQTIEIDPDNIRAHKELLKLAETNEDKEKIIFHKNELSRIKKTLGGKETKESEVKKSILEISPEVLENAKKHYVQGNMYYTKGNYEQAKEEYEQAIKLNPENAMYHYRLGLALQDLFLSDKAIKEFKKAIEYDSNFYDAYKSIGILYAQFGENKKAREALEKYIQLNPNARDIIKIKKLLTNMK
jgi:predicted Zn finger-like uncharacterized protein